MITSKKNKKFKFKSHYKSKLNRKKVCRRKELNNRIPGTIKKRRMERKNRMGMSKAKVKK